MGLKFVELQGLYYDSMAAESDITVRLEEEYGVPSEEIDVLRTQVARTERLIRMTVDEQDRMRRERERWWNKLIARIKERFTNV